MGTNGRSCVTCHVPTEGWTITPRGVRDKFEKTAGLDPLFRLVDGANSPVADVTTLEKRRQAYSMLLAKGNIRVGIGIPVGAEFTLEAVDDPYNYANEAELSLFHRPMPSTNLKFISAVMWEGRETTLDSNSRNCIFGTTSRFSPILFDLSNQANHATLGHAEASAALTDAEREAIVAFETSLFTAQVQVKGAGDLTDSTLGGPHNLVDQAYYFGINDTVNGDYISRKPFNSTVMELYNTWNKYIASKKKNDKTIMARAAIARGQALFNSKQILIREVKGINDDLNIILMRYLVHAAHVITHRIQVTTQFQCLWI